MKCGFCGAVAPLDDYCRTPIYGELPRNVYQCPSCRRAVEKRYGKATVYPSGFVMPGPVTLVEVGARL